MSPNPSPTAPLILGAFLFALFTATANAQPAPEENSDPLQVGAITLHRQDVPYVVDVPGRAVAFRQVDIRPRVDGVVTDILYVPGQELRVGDPLFQLDNASYAATVASGEAAVAEAEAELPLKQDAYDRALKLKGTGYTQSDVETAQSALASAKATLQSAQASLDYARTQLSWTTILSPIEGIPEVPDVSIGDLVSAGQDTALTMVTTLDPIEVDMLQASSSILAIRKQISQGIIKMGDTLDAHLTLEDGEVYEGTGLLVAPSATVSSSTGTVSVRFRFDNPDHQILPGMFLRGELVLGTINTFLVPQRAGEMSADGSFRVYLVSDEGVARQVSVVPTDSHENSWVVPEGLNEGDRLIIDGQKSLRDGMAVDAYEASLDENGLVVNAAQTVTSGN